MFFVANVFLVTNLVPFEANLSFRAQNSVESNSFNNLSFFSLISCEDKISFSRRKSNLSIFFRFQKTEKPKQQKLIKILAKQGSRLLVFFDRIEICLIFRGKHNNKVKKKKKSFLNLCINIIFNNSIIFKNIQKYREM